jgi:hypothetical protein
MILPIFTGTVVAVDVLLLGVFFTILFTALSLILLKERRRKNGFTS